jgi:2-polyprenyl-3-methyl-5-hydroxy-6-metoxy-1,4-benzoquinol methylase
MQSHWSEVSERISEREDGNLLTGDDNPYYRYKAAQFAAWFLPQIPVEGLNVLDVGRVAGGNLLNMARHNLERLVGCDQAVAMIELARRHVPGAPETLPACAGA